MGLRFCNRTDVDRHVAGRIRCARRAWRLTQASAAALIGVTVTQLRYYESAETRLSVGRIAIIAKVYQRPIEWFFPAEYKVATFRSG